MDLRHAPNTEDHFPVTNRPAVHPYRHGKCSPTHTHLQPRALCLRPPHHPITCTNKDCIICGG